MVMATVGTEIMLKANNAGALMAPNPVSLRSDATLHEALRLFTDTGFSAAPVIDVGGRPVGVLSRTDVIAYDRERAEFVPDYEDLADLCAIPRCPGRALTGPDSTRVADIMTAFILTVTPRTPARRVIEDMLAFKVHQLYVVDDAGVLVGVITTTEVLKALV